MAIDAVSPTRPRRWLASARHLALALLLAHAGNAMARDEYRDRSVIGTWKLVSVLDLATIASLDEAEAKTLLGKFLTISESAVQVDAELCSKPEFWAERVVPEPHMQEKLHSSAERLRLPNPATMVELGCTDVYIRNPGQLVLLWGGAMFDAVRIDPARRQPPASPSAAKRPPSSSTAQRPALRTEPRTGLKPVPASKSVMAPKPALASKPVVAPKPVRAAKSVATDKPGKTLEPARPSKRRTGARAPGASAVNELF